MKNSFGSEYHVIMHDYMKEAFEGCARSLFFLLSNKDVNPTDTHIYEDLLNLSHLERLQKQVAESNNENAITLNLKDWTTVYTSLGLYCICFSKKSLGNLRNEVLTHLELGSQHEIEQIHGRVPKVRTLVHDLEKRFGHKKFFQERHEEIKRRGWFNMMDPLPRYTVLK